MRSDMAKVIVERPRYGSRMRGQGKGYWRDLLRVPADELPKREGIKQSRGSRSKSFNEHLAPLRRYLFKQVGRPWNKVYAEICAHISRDSTVQDHVRDHVFDYVAAQVVAVDGVLFESTKWGGLVPLIDGWRHGRMYVCPRTGLLKRLKRSARRTRRTPEKMPVLHVPLDFETSFLRVDGVWHRVRLNAFPKTSVTGFHGFPLTVFDHLQQAQLTRADAIRHYGKAVFVEEGRQATREEIRKYCEPLKAPNRV